MSPARTLDPPTEHGFSTKLGADWNKYAKFRPIYPISFFERVYAYHTRKSGFKFHTAHDIGAGAGQVAAGLSSRFASVVVSDPNDGFTAIAKTALIQESGIPESKFQFLAEPAEQSSVEAGSIDLVTACECMHWTDADRAIREFARQLTPGGTLLMSYYTVPNIVHNPRAQQIWKAIWYKFIGKNRGEMFTRAAKMINTGFEHIALPSAEWRAVERVYINARGSVSSFTLDDRVGESRVQDGEERIWVEGDEDWCDQKGFDWLRGYIGTWVPPIPEAEIQLELDELKDAVGVDGTVRLETPVVMVMATRR